MSCFISINHPSKTHAGQAQKAQTGMRRSNQLSPTGLVFDCLDLYALTAIANVLLDSAANTVPLSDHSDGSPYWHLSMHATCPSLLCGKSCAPCQSKVMTDNTFCMLHVLLHILQQTLCPCQIRVTTHAAYVSSACKAAPTQGLHQG